MKRVCLLVVLLAVSVSCKKTTATAPTVLQVGGNWTATATRQASVVDTACPIIPASVTYSLQITQNGSDLTATASASGFRGVITYTGTSNATAATLSATNITSQATTPNHTCPDGTVVTVQVGTAAITINAVNGNTATGTDSTRYNNLVAGAQVSTQNYNNPMTLSK